MAGPGVGRRWLLVQMIDPYLQKHPDDRKMNRMQARKVSSAINIVALLTLVASEV